MSARRQASTTSLSKYARDGSPDPTSRSLDFCNAFWGPNDTGVDVLLARMRGAARTMEELRNFWKERAAIEEDYAKRLAKLAKLTLGRDEIGEFRNSLDTLRQETDKQSGFHIHLAQQIRNELENPVSAFVIRQAQHRKSYLAAVEKQFKTKQAQESHVNKAREKYEQDCLRINAYTAQSTLVQGKDLERITVKLERAQQTVHTNEREYSNFARALQDTLAKWEQEWKLFCDSCQDLEEERMDFTKDNVWVYANAVSIVCVSDDESCERLRLALESFEPEKDQETFVRDYGTGNAMPDPPPFVNYSSAEGALTSSASKITSRPAQFTRVSQRMNRQPTAPPPADEEPLVNTAGVGSGNRASNPSDPAPARATNLSRASTRRNPPASVTTNGNTNAHVPINGFSPSSSPVRRHTANVTSPTSTQLINPTQHELVVGENSYRVDLSKDQINTRAPPAPSKVGDDMDPMVQAMANLRTAASATVGRSATRKVTAPDASGTGGSSSAPPAKALTPPAPLASPSRNVDYRNSAEIVVGVHPNMQGPPSRSTSPVPPTASFMQPPVQAPAPVVDAVIDSYHQSFPGEHRGRPNSRRASFNEPQPGVSPSQVVQGNLLERPVSREGHAGIGANGRSRSPSINHPASRSTSPIPPGPARGGSINRLDQGAGQGHHRATTPNSVGISLDPHGNVAMDAMADVYRQQQQQQQVVQPRQVPQAQPPPPMQPPPPAPIQYQQTPAQPQQLQASGGAAARAAQRQTGVSNTYVAPVNWQTQAPAPPPQQYVPPLPVQQQPPQHTPAYAQAPHPYANAPPSQVYHPQLSYGVQQPPLPPQQQQQQLRQQTVQHGPTASTGGDYYTPQHQMYAPPPQQQRQQYQQQQQQHQHVAYGGGGGYRSLSPGPVNRSPSPQPMALTHPQPQSMAEPPTRQYTENGQPVLFYVRALYDYIASIPEEFDFQANDIIAVTATPEDGWWSGELLDENRRVPGKHIFPSNFVHLF